MGSRPPTLGNYIDWTRLVRCEEYRGDDADDTKLVKLMGIEAARTAMREFQFSSSVKTYCDPTATIGGIFAVVLVCDNTQEACESAYWMVIGDVPPIAMPWQVAAKPGQVVFWYLDLFYRWIDLVFAGKINEAERVYSHASLQPTTSSANQLAKKCEALNTHVLQYCIADVNDWSCAVL